MKPYLVDVPVAYQIWTRRSIENECFPPICQARPSVLFLVSDGGRTPEEQKKIYENRKALESRIDWDCTVYKLYEEKNHGMYAMGRIMWKYIFELVDRVIFFEEDTIASPSYFEFCAELLERYKDDERIMAISGNNGIGIYDLPTEDYFFSSVGWGSGAGLWKRSVQTSIAPNWMKEPYTLFSLYKLLDHDKPIYGKSFLQHAIPSLLNTGLYDGHPAGSEFYSVFEFYLHNRLTIVTTKNMVRQMGATDDASHAVSLKKLDRKTQQKFLTEIHECVFPICHPHYMIRDMEYERRIKKQHGSKIERFRRHFVTVCKRIYYGDGKIIWKIFVKRYLQGKKNIES